MARDPDISCVYAQWYEGIISRVLQIVFTYKDTEADAPSVLALGDGHMLQSIDDQFFGIVDPVGRSWMIAKDAVLTLRVEEVPSPAEPTPAAPGPSSHTPFPETD